MNIYRATQIKFFNLKTILGQTLDLSALIF